MPVLPDLGVAAIVALVVYFIILGILVVIVDPFDARTFAGIFLVLVGLLVGLVALDEPGLGTLVAGILAAIATDRAIEVLRAA